jgi:hypothetical protein
LLVLLGHSPFHLRWLLTCLCYARVRLYRCSLAMGVLCCAVLCCAVLCCDWSSAGHCPCRSSGCGFADCRRGMASSTWRAGVMRRCSLAWQPAASSVRKPLAGFCSASFVRKVQPSICQDRLATRISQTLCLCLSLCLTITHNNNLGRLFVAGCSVLTLVALTITSPPIFGMTYIIYIIHYHHYTLCCTYI